MLSNTIRVLVFVNLQTSSQLQADGSRPKPWPYAHAGVPHRGRGGRTRGLKDARAAAGFAGSQASERFGQGGVCVCLQLPDSTVPSHFLIPSSHLQHITHHGFVSFYDSPHDHALVHLRGNAACLAPLLILREAEWLRGRTQQPVGFAGRIVGQAWIALGMEDIMKAKGGSPGITRPWELEPEIVIRQRCRRAAGLNSREIASCPRGGHNRATVTSCLVTF
jgi:hypothetical protein